MPSHQMSDRPPRVRVWTQLLIAALLGVAGIGVAAPATAATGAIAPVSFRFLVGNDYHVPDRDLAVGGDLRISGEWSVPAGTAAGDHFTVTLPDHLTTVAGQRFALTGGGDDYASEYAYCDVDGQDIDCTFTDAITDAGAVTGFFWFRTSMVGTYSGFWMPISVNGADVLVGINTDITLPKAPVPSSADLDCWYTTSTGILLQETFPGGATSGSMGPASDVWIDPALVTVAYAPVSNYMGGANFNTWTYAPITATFDGATLHWSMPETGKNTDDYVIRIQVTATATETARSGFWEQCEGEVDGTSLSHATYFVPTGLDSDDKVARVEWPTIIESVCTSSGPTPPAIELPETPGVIYTIEYADYVPYGTARISAQPQAGWVLRIADDMWQADVMGRASLLYIFNDPFCGGPVFDVAAPPAPVVAQAVCVSGVVAGMPSIVGQEMPGVRYELDGDLVPGATATLVAFPEEGWSLVPAYGWKKGDNGTLRYTVTFDEVECGATPTPPAPPAPEPTESPAPEPTESPAPEPTQSPEPEPSATPSSEPTEPPQETEPMKPDLAETTSPDPTPQETVTPNEPASDETSVPAAG